MQSAERPGITTSHTAGSRFVALLRKDGLTIVSAVGTALTVISSLQDTLTVATWAKAIVDGFFAASEWFWAIVLPFLETAPRPMDVVFLNLSAFFAILALASLAPRERIRWHWREASWFVEGTALVGMFSASALILWSGSAVVEAAYIHETYPAMAAAMEAASTDAEREEAAVAAFTGLSAFFPFADALHAAFGFERGALLSRIEEVLVIMMALSATIILLPASLVWGVAAIFGYFNDGMRTARWVWLFLGLVVAVLALSSLAQLWVSVCTVPVNPVLEMVCSLF